ncbi:MAG: hypothetical protein GY723_23595 [bacterium]|nr:hypothetical protein [bacterium]MCP5067293.1 hypothetical protein [bacterium]
MTFPARNFNPLAVWALILAFGLATSALAYVPPAKQVAAAVAKANLAAKRNRALAMEVTLHRDDSAEAIASGTLITDPSGNARLELRIDGRVERHLRVGARLETTHDGRAHTGELRLPPLHLLQLVQRTSLQTALAALGASGGAIELGYDDDLDAYVLGGRGATSLWVDMESLSPVRIDLPTGIIVRLGPLESFDGVLWPAWLEIQHGEAPRVRLLFRGVTATATSPETFRREWLLPDRQPRP